MDIKLKGFVIGFVCGASILFLVIAGIVLWQLGPSPQRNVNKSTGFTGGKIGALDASIKCNTTDLSVVLTNQAGSTLSNITVAQSNIGYDGAVSGVGAAGTLPPNKATTLVMDADTLFAVDDSVITDVVVTYNERVTGNVISKGIVIPRKQSGMIMCTVE